MGRHNAPSCSEECNRTPGALDHAQDVPDLGARRHAVRVDHVLATGVGDLRLVPGVGAIGLERLARGHELRHCDGPMVSDMGD